MSRFLVCRDFIPYPPGVAHPRVSSVCDNFRRVTEGLSTDECRRRSMERCDRPQWLEYECQKPGSARTLGAEASGYAFFYAKHGHTGRYSAARTLF